MTLAERDLQSEADLNDLQNYLKFTIGRSAQDTVALLDKLARMIVNSKAGAVRYNKLIGLGGRA